MNRRFRLATVLRLRSQSERTAADALRAANATLDEARARVDDVVAQLAQPAPQAGTPQQPLTEETADLLAAAHHRARLREELATARGEVERLVREAELARETWLRARAALRAVESLQTRHLAALRAHELRVEQRAADELAGRRRPAAATTPTTARPTPTTARPTRGDHGISAGFPLSELQSSHDQRESLDHAAVAGGAA